MIGILSVEAEAVLDGAVLLEVAEMAALDKGVARLDAETA